VNNEIHGTTKQISYIRLKEENLNPLLRECIIDKTNMRKDHKDCLFSYAGNQYSVPSEYVAREVAVLALDNVLFVYCGGEQIATHKLCLEKGRIIMFKEHYKAIRYANNHYKNVLLVEGLDTISSEINLAVYDE